jgi:hypothetical protein
VASVIRLPRGRVVPCVAFILILALTPAAESARADAGTPVFVPLEPGLELGQAAVRSGTGDSEALFTILRIDPMLHTFTLCMASEDGRSRSLPDWSKHGDLRAGINASMYLPDGITSTGYLRNGDSVNNGNAGPRLGAFFAAEPRRRGRIARKDAAGLCPERPAGDCKDRLPAACILERDAPGMPGILEDYAVVAQNFRFMDKAGNTLWPEGGRAAGMAVVAEDGAGRILFILCRDALTAERFAAVLRGFSLALRTVMYVEGGGQAGLFLRIDDAVKTRDGIGLDGASAFPAPDGVVYVWKGRNALLNADGDPQGILPNVLGVRRRR